jgi:PAS domain S-box-containing protein
MTDEAAESTTLASVRPTASRPAMDQLVAAIEAMPEGCVMFDATDRLVFCNAAYRRSNPGAAHLLVPGTPFEAILWANLRGLRFDLRGRDAERFFEHRMAVHRQPSAPFEQRLADGRWEQVRETRLPDGGTLLLLSDVTDRMNAAGALAGKSAELAASERRFRDYADASADWFWETDAELRYTYMDDRSFTLINQPTQSRIGKRRDKITDLDLDQPHWQQHLADLEARRPFRDFRYRVRTVDGVLRWISVSGKPILGAGGTFAGYRGAARDVTAEMAAQARASDLAARNAALVAAVDGLADAVALYDDTERLVFWNHAFAQHYPQGDSLLKPGTTFTELLLRGLDVGVPPVAPEQREGYIVRRMTFHAQPEGVFERQTAGGQWQQIREHPLADGGFMVMISDVTRRRRTEAQLHQAQKMEAVGQLTGGLAHDLNNLLGVVMGNLEQARDRVSDPMAREAIADALSAAERGGELNRQLLAFARRQPLRPTRINPNEVVSSMSRLVARMIGETIRVRIDAAGDIWPVKIDRAQLESAILNLAVNARDAMPLGGRLTVSTENVRVGPKDHAAPLDLPEGDYVTISVADNGVGMPPEVLARAFEPFFTTKAPGQGSGLGLSQVYGFINQSHGRVQIESAPGMGTVVTLYLPRAPLAGETEAAAARTSSHPAGIVGATVLVVDDNEELRQIAVQQLRDTGYRVLEAPDAARALEFIGARSDIDLLFTDIVLPGGIDGRALAWAAREVRPRIKLLFTSGFADLEPGPEGPPGVELLAKPYRRATLAHAVQRALLA